MRQGGGAVGGAAYSKTWVLKCEAHEGRTCPGDKKFKLEEKKKHRNVTEKKKPLFLACLLEHKRV